MSTSTLGTFGELSVEKQLLTVVTWLVAAVIFLMVATQGIVDSLAVAVITGVVLAFVVAWATAVVLAE